MFPPASFQSFGGPSSGGVGSSGVAGALHGAALNRTQPIGYETDFERRSKQEMAEASMRALSLTLTPRTHASGGMTPQRGATRPPFVGYSTHRHAQPHTPAAATAPMRTLPTSAASTRKPSTSDIHFGYDLYQAHPAAFPPPTPASSSAAAAAASTYASPAFNPSMTAYPSQALRHFSTPAPAPAASSAAAFLAHPDESPLTPGPQDHDDGEELAATSRFHSAESQFMDDELLDERALNESSVTMAAAAAVPSSSSSSSTYGSTLSVPKSGPRSTVSSPRSSAISAAGTRSHSAAPSPHQRVFSITSNPAAAATAAAAAATSAAPAHPSSLTLPASMLSSSSASSPSARQHPRPTSSFTSATVSPLLDSAHPVGPLSDLSHAADTLAHRIQALKSEHAAEILAVREGQRQENADWKAKQTQQLVEWTAENFRQMSDLAQAPTNSATTTTAVPSPAAVGSPAAVLASLGAAASATDPPATSRGRASTSSSTATATAQTNMNHHHGGEDSNINSTSTGAQLAQLTSNLVASQEEVRELKTKMDQLLKGLAESTNAMTNRQSPHGTPTMMANSTSHSHPSEVEFDPSSQAPPPLPEPLAPSAMMIDATSAVSRPASTYVSPPRSPMMGARSHHEGRSTGASVQHSPRYSDGVGAEAASAASVQPSPGLLSTLQSLLDSRASELTTLQTLLTHTQQRCSSAEKEAKENRQQTLDARADLVDVRGELSSTQTTLASVTAELHGAREQLASMEQRAQHDLDQVEQSARARMEESGRLAQEAVAEVEQRLHWQMAEADKQAQETLAEVQRAAAQAVEEAHRRETTSVDEAERRGRQQVEEVQAQLADLKAELEAAQAALVAEQERASTVAATTAEREEATKQEFATAAAGWSEREAKYKTEFAFYEGQYSELLQKVEQVEQARKSDTERYALELATTKAEVEKVKREGEDELARVKREHEESFTTTKTMTTQQLDVTAAGYEAQLSAVRLELEDALRKATDAAEAQYERYESEIALITAEAKARGWEADALTREREQQHELAMKTQEQHAAAVVASALAANELAHGEEITALEQQASEALANMQATHQATLNEMAAAARTEAREQAQEWARTLEEQRRNALDLRRRAGARLLASVCSGLRTALLSRVLNTWLSRHLTQKAAEDYILGLKEGIEGRPVGQRGAQQVRKYVRSTTPTPTHATTAGAHSTTEEGAHASATPARTTMTTTSSAAVHLSSTAAFDLPPSSLHSPTRTIPFFTSSPQMQPLARSLPAAHGHGGRGDSPAVPLPSALQFSLTLALEKLQAFLRKQQQKQVAFGFHRWREADLKGRWEAQAKKDAAVQGGHRAKMEATVGLQDEKEAAARKEAGLKAKWAEEKRLEATLRRKWEENEKRNNPHQKELDEAAAAAAAAAIKRDLEKRKEQERARSPSPARASFTSLFTSPSQPPSRGRSPALSSATRSISFAQTLPTQQGLSLTEISLSQELGRVTARSPPVTRMATTSALRATTPPPSTSMAQTMPMAMMMPTTATTVDGLKSGLGPLPVTPWSPPMVAPVKSTTSAIAHQNASHMRAFLDGTTPTTSAAPTQQQMQLQQQSHSPSIAARSMNGSPAPPSTAAMSSGPSDDPFHQSLLAAQELAAKFLQSKGDPTAVLAEASRSPLMRGMTPTPTQQQQMQQQQQQQYQQHSHHQQQLHQYSLGGSSVHSGSPPHSNRSTVSSIHSTTTTAVSSSSAASSYAFAPPANIGPELRQAMLPQGQSPMQPTRHQQQQLQPHQHQPHPLHQPARPRSMSPTQRSSADSSPVQQYRPPVAAARADDEISFVNGLHPVRFRAMDPTRAPGVNPLSAHAAPLSPRQQLQQQQIYHPQQRQQQQPHFHPMSSSPPPHPIQSHGPSSHGHAHLAGPPPKPADGTPRTKLRVQLPRDDHPEGQIRTRPVHTTIGGHAGANGNGNHSNAHASQSNPPARANGHHPGHPTTAFYAQPTNSSVAHKRSSRGNPLGESNGVATLYEPAEQSSYRPAGVTASGRKVPSAQEHQSHTASSASKKRAPSPAKFTSDRRSQNRYQ